MDHHLDRRTMAKRMLSAVTLCVLSALAPASRAGVAVPAAVEDVRAAVTFSEWRSAAESALLDERTAPSFLRTLRFETAGAPVAALNCYEAAALEAWHMLNGGRIDEGEFVKLAIGAAHSCGGGCPVVITTSAIAGFVRRDGRPRFYDTDVDTFVMKAMSSAAADQKATESRYPTVYAAARAARGRTPLVMEDCPQSLGERLASLLAHSQ
jgi:hypothetical protein